MKVTCAVDNAVGWGSALWGEHGLAFLIETEDGSRVLFDTGQSGVVLLHNLAELRVDAREISALALSHAHRDHTGGLEALVEQCPGLRLHAHPSLFQERFSRHGEEVESIGLRITQEALATRVDLCLSAAPVEVVSGVWTTGEITSRPEREGRSTRHLVRQADRWIPDPYRDDLSLVLHTAEGLVLLAGCCHAGLLNTLLHVRCTFGDGIVGVAGGTHLGDADEAYLQHVAAVLEDEYHSPRLCLNHCTGDLARRVLATGFGQRVRACPAGTVLTF